MNDDRDTLARLLGGLVPPEPPRELHGEVMRAATVALAREAPRDVWTRLWESRPLRVAWASLVLLLLLANALAPRAIWPSGMRGTAPAAAADELESIAHLPRIDLDTLPAIGSGPPAARVDARPVHLLQKTKEGPS